MKTKSLSKSFLPLVIGSAVAGIISSIASPAQAIQTWNWSYECNTNTCESGFTAQSSGKLSVENNKIVAFSGIRMGYEITDFTIKGEPWLGPDNGWFKTLTYHTKRQTEFGPETVVWTKIGSGYFYEEDTQDHHVYKSNGFFQANLVPPVSVPFETSPYSVLVGSLALGAMVAAKKAKQNIALKTRVANPVETIS